MRNCSADGNGTLASSVPPFHGSTLNPQHHPEVASATVCVERSVELFWGEDSKLSEVPELSWTDFVNECVNEEPASWEIREEDLELVTALL